MTEAGPEHRQHVAESWCRWYDRQNPDDQWAETEVIDGITLGQESVEEGWATVLALLTEARSHKVLGVIGASPIEDQLARDPSIVAGWIQAEAPSNEPLRRALSHLWRMPLVPDDIFTAVKALAQNDLSV